MKRLIYTFLVLLFSLQGVVAHNFPSTAHIYFAKPEGWTGSYYYFFIGNNNWSSDPKQLSKISNTLLYYAKQTSWNDYGYDNWAVFNTTGTWTGSGGSLYDRKIYAAASTWVGNSKISTYNLIPLASTSATTGTSYTFLNKTHTIKLYVDDVESSEGGSVKASSYKLSSASATSATSGTTSIEAAYTATIKLTATVNAGYEFLGWYEGTTLMSSSTTYSYTAPNSAKTISAKFKKLEAAAPQITSFTASASEIDLGESVTFSVEVENAEVGDVVFKNGDETITNPWTPTAGGEYTITANLDGATSQSVKVTVYAATVYFDNTISGWSNVYAYCWTDGDKNAEWPGVELTNPAGNIYTYKTIKSYKNIIFTNNSGAQTADLEFVNDSTYSMPEPAPFVAGTENLCGSSWNATDEKNKMAEVEGATDLFSKTYSNLAAGDYQFKVVYEGGWLGYDNLDTENSTKGTENKDGNIGFTLIDKTDVTISYNVATKKIVITAAGIDNFGYTYFPVGEKIYLSSDKGASRYAAYLYGPGDKNTWADVAATDYKNIYSLTVPEGEWNGLIFCAMKKGTTTNDWNNKDAQTADLRYEGDNWHFWGTKEGVSSYWRKYENLILAGQKLYFKPDSNWEAKNARFAAYYWDILGENAWADCVYNEEKDVYEVVAPTSGSPACAWTNMKFVRINPKYTDNAWNDDKVDDRVWNETENLVFDGVNDLFIIKLTKKLEGTENLDWNSADVNNWINYGVCFREVVFLKPNEVQASSRFAVWFWNGFDQGCWGDLKLMSGQEGIYYVVVPEGFWTGANICAMKAGTTENSWDNKSLQTDNLTYHSDKLLYVVPNKWEDKAIADEYWVELSAENGFVFNPNDEMEIKDGVAAGAYYKVKKYTMQIASSEVNKWHWISLPYDVNVADIKSNGEIAKYGIDFILKRYDTANRAAWEGEQPPVDDNTWVQLTADDVLKAGRGYILGVNNLLTEGVELVFPANKYFHEINDQVTAENRDYSSGLAVNSNWHLIGTGLYGATTSSSSLNYVAYPDASGSDYTYHYLGEQVVDEYFNPTTATASTLGMYKAFFVQYAGEYSFATDVAEATKAPRRARAEEVVEQYYINLTSEKSATQTAIFLAEDGSDEYVVGKDFLHFGVTGQSAQLYTKQGSRLMSFNHLKTQDCVVDLGGYIADAGEYTISLTDNGASSIVLIDNITGESIDLTTENYTFTAERGSLDGRFSIAIAYVRQDVTTEVMADDEANVVIEKYGEEILVSGLTVGDEVYVYDAVGRCVEQFEADEASERLLLSGGVYVLKTSKESVKFVVW